VRRGGAGNKKVLHQGERDLGLNWLREDAHDKGTKAVAGVTRYRYCIYRPSDNSG